MYSRVKWAQHTSIATTSTESTTASSWAATSLWTLTRHMSFLITFEAGHSCTPSSTTASSWTLARHVSFLIAFEAGHFSLGGTVTGDVALLLAVEALVAASLGALTREVTFLSTFETFWRGAANTASPTLVWTFTGHVSLLSTFKASRAGCISTEWLSAASAFTTTSSTTVSSWKQKHNLF